MIRVDHAACADRYRDDERESIAQALEILAKLKFFEFLVERNSAILVASLQTEESEQELAKRILDNRQTNRILLSIPALQLTVQGDE